MWTQLEEKLIKWESNISKKNNSLSEEEKQYIKKELPLIKAEKKQMEHRLRKLNEIIAKTKILVDDLTEDECRELSKGHSLAEVGEALKEEFGNKLEEGQSQGKHTLINFLKSRYNIDKKTARELFNLLEDAGVIYYKVDIPKNALSEPIIYEPLEADVDIPETMYALYGDWIINS